MSSYSAINIESDAPIIYPPPDRKKWIDTAAQYVATHGDPFIAKMLERDSKKFDFLLPSHAYRAYFDMRVGQLKRGETDTSGPAIPAAIIEMRRLEDEKRRKKEQYAMITNGEGQNEIKPPPPDIYSIRDLLTQKVDIDVMKVTAQFTALNGEQFLVGLSQREGSNPAFEFIRQSHILHNYFCQLVEAYKKCILPSGDSTNRFRDLCRDVDIKSIERGTDLALLSNNGYVVPVSSSAQQRCLSSGQIKFLERCRARYLFESKILEDETLKNQKEKEDKAAEEAIDWTTFAVVHTVIFDEKDKITDLRAPQDLKGIKAKQAKMFSESSNVIESVLTAEKQKEVDAMNEATSAAMAAVQRKLLPSVADDGIPIIHDYKRVVPARTATTIANEMVACPITGQQVKKGELSNHLRIVLLDPQWKLQKDKVMARMASADTNLVSNSSDFAANIQRLMEKRPEFFTDSELQRNIEGENPLSKRIKFN